MKKRLLFIVTLLFSGIIFGQELNQVEEFTEIAGNVNVTEELEDAQTESIQTDDVEEKSEIENVENVENVEKVEDFDDEKIAEAEENVVVESGETIEESSIVAENSELQESVDNILRCQKNLEQAKQNYEERIEEINSFYLEKFKSAENRKQTVAAELGQQVDIQKEKDIVRLAEDELSKAKRTVEENAEVNRKEASLQLLLDTKGTEFGAKKGAEENIYVAEEIKAKIWQLREDVRQKSEAFNLERNKLAEEKINQINNAPYVDGETDSSGEPTRTAQQRRTNLCNEELALAKSEEEAYLAQLKAEIAKTEKEYFSQLKQAYYIVDSGKYETNSFTDDVVLRISDFNGEHGYWKVKISSGIFGYPNLLDMEFDLSYEELTGKKFLKTDQLTEEEFVQFQADIALYDHLFRINSNAVYAKVYYEIKHWKEASEYRFMPYKLEIIRIAETPKVVHKETRIQGKNFINYASEVYEVRSQEDILKDVKRAAKINEKEQKKAGTYNPAYSYNSNGTKDIVPQKGRGAFTVMGVFDFPDSGMSPLTVDSLSAEVTFGIGKHVFVGGDFDIQLPFIKEQFMEYGIVGGANWRLGKFVRPYLKGTANISNTYNGIVKAGAGVDFTFGIFMLNVGYDYAWNFDFNNHFNPSIDKTTLTDEDFKVHFKNNHAIYVGVGIAF